jgi:hypothetical protein
VAWLQGAPLREHHAEAMVWQTSLETDTCPFVVCWLGHVILLQRTYEMQVVTVTELRTQGYDQRLKSVISPQEQPTHCRNKVCF